MSAFVSNNKLYLNGMVGEYEPFECFTYETVMTALDSLDRNSKITVHINSPGGWASEGAAIYSGLTALPLGVDVVVDGIAASAGSLIAMAGKTVTMAVGSMMMIHDASRLTLGNSDDHQRAMGELETMSNVYAGIYAKKTKKTVAACRNLMKVETWFEPQEAVSAGFADKLGGSSVKMMAAFDYSQFQNAPKRLLDLTVAHNWNIATIHPAPPKEEKMTDPNPATARAEAAARIKAILTHAEAKGRSELAEHLALETDIEPEAAFALMAKAGKSSAPNHQTTSYHDQRLAAVAGLARPSVGEDTQQQPGGLVANMKRRHGVKEGN